MHHLERFRDATRARRRNPARVPAGFMEETLEVWEGQDADEGIRQDARQSGYREEDAAA